jgi:two-component system cell cycle sensor histidine kinase/response regulator CckA
MAERPSAWPWRRTPASSAEPFSAEFLALFAASPDGQALISEAGGILAANPALARLAGPALPLSPGLPVARLVAGPDRDALAAHLAAARSGQRDLRPLHAAPADPAAPADTAWGLLARRVRQTRSRPGTLLLLTVTDRTEQQRAAQRLAASARLETVGRLAGGIAHDFNNLLTAILGAAAAAREAGLNADAASEVAQIEDAARRGATLVRQILAFAQRQHLLPQVLDLRLAVEETAPLLRRLLGKQIGVELALGAEGPLVRIDPAQLDQVLLNLAANAREAMPDGGTLRIALDRAVVLRREGDGPEALPPGRYAVLEVADNGRGMPPEVQARLFEPFFTTRPERGGTGLGLATVQGIVAQSGGQIVVSSRVGEGTTFRIHLPRFEGSAKGLTAPAAAASRDAPPASRAPSAPAPGPRARTLLLVEDEAPLRRLSERILQRAGFPVTVVDCAEAALDWADSAAEAPAILVSDVAMPVMDGISLARRLRERWPRLPVLLLSGYAEAVLGADLEAAGLAFLPKPFSPGDLVDAVRRAAADCR